MANPYFHIEGAMHNPLHFRRQLQPPSSKAQQVSGRLLLISGLTVSDIGSASSSVTDSVAGVWQRRSCKQPAFGSSRSTSQCLRTCCRRPVCDSTSAGVASHDDPHLLQAGQNLHLSGARR